VIFTQNFTYPLDQDHEYPFDPDRALQFYRVKPINITVVPGLI
jgi:hypothetical protein